MAKIALLIGVSEYESGLVALPGAVHDVAALKQALENPQVGGFDDIRELINPEPQAMREAIELVFSDRTKDDLVVLFFSGHGIKDDQGRLYFATPRTRTNPRGELIKSTAVPAVTIHEFMSGSRAKRQVVILDCCFSGAFATDMPAKSAPIEDISADIRSQLGAEGRAVLASSTATQYSLEQPDAALSVYTRYLVQGLNTGAADLDSDGVISVDELHEYARSKVHEAAPAMKPEIYAVREGYKILLAKSPKDDPRLKYRKRVKHLAEEDEGDFSFINREYLFELQRSLGLSIEVATAIENEELEPFRQRRAKVDRYRDLFSGAIAQRYPLIERDRIALKRFQELWSLRDEDITAIETPILASRQIEQPPLTPRVAPTVTRQQFLKWAGFGSGGLMIVLVGNQIIQNQGNPNPETVAVNDRGRIIKRTPIQPEGFQDDLGNNVALEMVAIPAGEFLMGTAGIERNAVIQEYTQHGDSQSDAEQLIGWEMPQHRVKVPEFWLGKFAVTQAQWQQVAGFARVNIDLDPDPANFKGVKRPIEQVSWDEAVEFCQRISRQSGKLYRLPTEAEWEYACRAGTTTPFHFGDTITTELVNCNGNYSYGKAPEVEYREQTTDVGIFPPNAFGLYDMHGNVWEWCADQWYDSYANKPDQLKENGAITPPGELLRIA